MRSEKHLAFISPRDGFAGLLSVNQQTVELVAPPAVIGKIFPAGNYASRFPDTAVIEVASDIEAIQCLAEYQDNCLALDYSLLLFDPCVSQSTRTEVATQLNELLQNNTRRDYALDVILATPLPDDADIEAARHATLTLDRARDLVVTILECQSRVKAMQVAWATLRSNPIVQQAGIRELQGALIDTGVFRRLIENGKTQVDVQSLKRQIVLDNDVRSRCDARILAKLITEYSSALPAGLGISQATIITELKQDSRSPGREEIDDERDVRRTTNSEQAQRQVERIAELYSQGNDATAKNFLQELVDSQTQDDFDPSYVVKSLCNIANRCTSTGRRDIALMCLSRALEYPDGIDAVLYTQMGNALRDLKRFDEALACYEQARQYDRGNSGNKILLEIIRTSIARKDYAAALVKLQQLPDLYASPQSLCLLGTLHRRLGELSLARRCYFDVLANIPDYHQALAGRAETNKQAGRYWKAIHRYNDLLKGKVVIDSHSRKVYSLAQAFLFRVTHQNEAAKAILSDLQSLYPSDGDVHLQLAKVWMVEGNTNEARRHFNLAEKSSLDQVAIQTYLAAIGQHYSSRTFDTDEMILPEDQGIWRCNQAMISIANGEYETAQNCIRNLRFVDRTHADLGAVLAFHARKRIDPTFSYKSDHIISRIAKRGQRELRQSIEAINHGDFANAELLERRTCLLIA